MAQAGADAAQCRGPGRYESGKEGSYQPCCAGLSEVSYGKPSFTGAFATQPVCDAPPLRVYACVRGTCGDGMCEEGEAPACGCVEDCPQAAWDTPAKLEEAKRESRSERTPMSCAQPDVVSMLQQDAPGTHCGDLALGATESERSAAASCARTAYVQREPFEVFWRVQGEDSIVHQGLVGRASEHGFLVYSVFVDANVFSIDLPGAVASWALCTPEPGTTCKGPLEDCLACARSEEYPACACLPEGARPGAPDGAKVEVLCQ
jgi:hypothetical protein